MDRFVTLAVHSYEKAQSLMHILNNEGIEAYTEEVNKLFPTISVGVKVRVKAKDLEKALEISENLERLVLDNEKTILVPYDFAEYSYKIFPLAFSWAKMLDAKVVLFHTFLSQVPERQSILNRILDVDKEDYQKRREEELRVEKEKQKIAEAMIQNLISDGTLENVPYVFKSNEGVPEEQIVNYAKKYKPLLIAMSTRSGSRKTKEMIGSVSAEVAEEAPLPVFVLPEDVELLNVEELKKIVFITNFEDQDIKAFDKMMTRLSFQEEEIYLLHVPRDEHKDVWSEIKLEGIKSYFKENYKVSKVEYALISKGDRMQMSKYIVSNDIKVMAFSTHRRTMLAKLLGEGTARKMVYDAERPMFVFHA